MPIFDHAHSKIIESTFNFPDFAPACKQSVHSIYSFLRYSQFPWPDWTRIFDQAHPEMFWSTFNQSTIHWIVLEIGFIKISCNLIGQEHFGQYPRNKISPNMGFVQEHSGSTDNPILEDRKVSKNPSCSFDRALN